MTFVDMNKIAIDTTKKNLSSLNISNAEVLFMKDEMAIQSFINNKKVFDIVFIDPPYKEGRYSELVNTFIDDGLLSEHGIIVIESDHDVSINDALFLKRRDYKYGDIKVAILWR